MYSIYKLTSPSGKSYIGQTRRSSQIRFQEHNQAWERWKRNRSEETYQRKLFEGFDEFDFESFTKEVLDTCETQDEANALERRYIEIYNSVENGYNTTYGGQGLHRLTLNEDHKEKIGMKQKAAWDSPKGKERKQKHKERLKEHNPMVEANRGKPTWNAGKSYEELVGEERANEINKKRRDAQIGKSRDCVAKTYIVTSPQGEISQVTNLRQFAKIHNLTVGNLTKKYGSKGWKAVLKDK